MRWMMPFIAACFLIAAASTAMAEENCRVCHRVATSGIHAALACKDCHGNDGTTTPDPASAAHKAKGCTSCHNGYGRLFDHAMATRTREKQFVKKTFAKADPHFFDRNCQSCHLRGCTDCHGGSGHSLAQARDRNCFACHRGYFVGSEYYGMAPREDSLRYQRGETAYGETFLKMLPDVHAEAGIACSSCHTMQSLIAGARTAKGCLDCHKPSKKVLEHRIKGHLERMECYACHSAWGAQEYGTFYLRFTDSPSQQDYRLKTVNGNYVKSAYLKKQDAPPLGVNARGMVTPIRPQFIAYFSDIRNDMVVGEENRLLTASWKAFFPHTVRRGTVMCDGCHDAPRRFIMEGKEDRIYRLQDDGMKLPSFWDRTGQKVMNGDFLSPARYRAMTEKNAAYQRAYVEKWKKLTDRVENSSLP
ncbi:menaquinol oxidoreductase complex Cbc6, cytochrome c subunit, putative, 10 heme-binding sites [Geotalea daltonii FRC-32]|uniref:Menaquinol oxidoreductase complex Cbc6, cytochrome c subunit, putative, 10 heme-binding sites n=1 Tax=Geotalea daltonii (strain DSM 22248 / JCM 15807 / FRC-32) TaxID=316067 RepID=B9M4H8_GEODF|nr:selenite/tellurite reduction operon b-type cytochrome iron-sulfur cluster-binding subunit ExtO [Geotalea daltonii]ACM19704.1 menaquinol oxidoreductase complex Cbc6, cytochrome c subunit, putative, 10 heme-binding sites [Geotalea daltonii FRC-32]